MLITHIHLVALLRMNGGNTFTQPLVFAQITPAKGLFY
jgi:hypothetical protein